MHRPLTDLGELRAVFFDAGFTLMEPRLPIEQIYIATAEDLGVRLDHEAFKRHMGECWKNHTRDRGRSDDLSTSDEDEHRGWHAFTGAVAAPFPDLVERHEEWLERLVARFDEATNWKPYPGVMELLDRLREHGLTLGIISNWHSVLRTILDAHGFTKRFDFVLVSAEFGWRKPHPSIFEEALERAGVAAHESLHVGDSVTDDVHGAYAVGIQPVLVSRHAPDGDLPGMVTHIEGTADLLDALSMRKTQNS